MYANLHLTITIRLALSTLCMYVSVLLLGNAVLLIPAVLIIILEGREGGIRGKGVERNIHYYRTEGRF